MPCSGLEVWVPDSGPASAWSSHFLSLIHESADCKVTHSKLAERGAQGREGGNERENRDSCGGGATSDGGVLLGACGCMPEHLALPAIGMCCVPGSRAHLRNRVSPFMQYLIANLPSQDKSCSPTGGFCFLCPNGRLIFAGVWAPWGRESYNTLSRLKSPPLG